VTDEIVKDKDKEKDKETEGFKLEDAVAKIVEKSKISVPDDSPPKIEDIIEPRIHDDWLADYVKYTNYTEAPALFHLWTGVSIIAAALNRNVFIQRGYDRLYPNLFTVLVSPTGGTKTYAANIGVNTFLQKIDGTRILRDETSPKGLVQYLQLAPYKKDGSKQYQECTAYVYATELSDLLGEQSYNKGLIRKLTALWDSPTVYNDTTKEILVRAKAPVVLTNVCLNMFGCSNPEWLADGLKEDSFGGGFMGRTLFVYADDKRKSDASAWLEVPKDIQITALTLLADLQKIAKLKGPFTVDQEAHDFYIKLYMEHDGNFTGRMKGYLERKIKAYVLKLAMILCANYSDQMLIKKCHIEGALHMLNELEKTMPQAFVYINSTNESKIAQKIIESIKDNRGAEYRSVLIEKFRHLVRNIREFDDIVQLLIESKVLKYILAGPKADRPTYILMTIFEKLDASQKQAAIIEQMQSDIKAQNQNVKETHEVENTKSNEKETIQ
jgi:hypothetical protein